MHKEEQVDLSTFLTSSMVSEGQDVNDTSVTTTTATLLLDCHNLLGEGIIYDDQTNTVLWTDILNSTFHSLQLNYINPNQSIHRIYNLPKKLGSFGLLERSTGDTGTATTTELPLLCAWEDGFQLYDIHQHKVLSNISIGEDVNPAKGLTRLNDGRVDPTGQRFICGGFYGNTSGITMKVYRVEQQQQQHDDDDKIGTFTLYHTPIIDTIEVTNSICWNLDGTKMYFADSPTRQIHTYNYDLITGTVSNKQLFHTKLTNEVGVPDGSCVDSDGYIWNAIWKNGVESSCVQRIHPITGLVTYVVQMPDTTSQVSCCCFGGQGMNILFITTAGESRDPNHEPHAGGLYAVRVPYIGRKESRLKFVIPDN